MASTISIIYIILVSAVCLDVTKSELASHNNKINRTSAWKSVRTKRSLSNTMPFILRIKIKYETDEEMDLVWTKRDLYLANENLPVIIPFLDSNLNIMNDIGEFISYYDPNQCSAVVYFKKSKSFFGVIGTNYYIDNLPFDFDDNGEHRLGVIGTPFIRRNRQASVHIDPTLDPPPPSDAEAWADYIRAPIYDAYRSLKRPSNCDSSTSSKYPRMKRNVAMNENEHKNSTIRRRRGYSIGEEYYLETLVFVTLDIVEPFKRVFGPNHYIEWIVKHLIVYFSAVDMIFQKLPIIRKQIFINIAKIVIEDELTPFDFMCDGELQFTDIAAKLPQYLHDHQSYYAPDSFDHVFIYTSRTIMDGVIQINGMTKQGRDWYEARKHDQFYAVVPITVVKFKYFFADYVATVYEIGRILNMRIAPKENGMKSEGQCYSIMQRDGPKCKDCLKWNSNSEQRFKTFFSENRNRCFLMNEPRSLRPPGASRFLSPHRQCRCFGYDSHVRFNNGKLKYAVRRNECKKPLRCIKSDGDQLQESFTVRPFDGTSCTHTNKVCWNGECIPERTKLSRSQSCST